MNEVHPLIDDGAALIIGESAKFLLPVIDIRLLFLEGNLSLEQSHAVCATLLVVCSTCCASCWLRIMNHRMAHAQEIERDHDDDRHDCKANNAVS